MPLSLKINGVERADVVRRIDSWNLRKQRGVENFTFKMVASLVSKPFVGDEILVYDGSDLIFGGQVLSLTQERERAQLFYVVQCRDWNLLAEQTRFSGTITAGPLYERAFEVYSDWLMPKGVTWLGASTGGPAMASDVVFKRATPADVLNRMGRPLNYLWRINGLRQFGWWAPGTLPFPKSMTGDDWVAGIKVDQNYYERATRLFLTTGGSGDATHTETHYGNGLKSYFLLNVEPKEDQEDSDGNVISYKPTEVVVNGVTYPLDGTTWYYDAVNHAVQNLSAAVPNGHAVSVTYTIGFPAVVRVWQPELLTTAGQIDVSFLVDKDITVSFITDVSEAVQWGEAELLSRSGEPLKVRGTTMVKGFYPGLVGNITYPGHGIDANFLVESVNIRDIGIDGRKTEFLFYDLELIEGDVPGRQWQDVYREALSSSGGSQVTQSGNPYVPPTEPTEPTVGVAFTGQVIHLGGANNVTMPATTTFRDIPEMIPNKFGGSAMSGNWTFKAYGLLVGGAGTLQIEVFDGTTQLGVASITSTGSLLDPLAAATPVTIAAPGSLTDIWCRYRVIAGTNTVRIGHCVLQKV